MQWQMLNGWNLIVTITAVVVVMVFVRHSIYHGCMAYSKKLHTEVIAQIAKETERVRLLERWTERIERLVMDLRQRVISIEKSYSEIDQGGVSVDST